MSIKNNKKTDEIEIFSGVITAKESLRFLAYISKLDCEVEAVPFGKLFKRPESIRVGDKIEGYFEGDRFILKKILPRKNSLLRPKIANIDFVAITVSIIEPQLSLFQLDKMITVYLHYNTTPIIIFNKIDILDEDNLTKLNKLKKYYESINIKCIKISALNDNLTEKLSTILKNGTLIFAGPSGTGKSTIINSLTGLDLITDEISHKNKKGRHTTVDSKLIKVNNFFIGDTPGFSELYPHMIITEENEVKNLFPEMKNSTCKYSNCNHLNEPDCSIKESIKNGEILESRYESYKYIFNDIKGNAIKW